MSGDMWPEEQTKAAYARQAKLPMGIYLVSRTDTVGYDEYDSFVVVASSPAEAKSFLDDLYGGRDRYGSWSYQNEVKLIGTASKEYTEPTEILGSFNAG